MKRIFVDFEMHPVAKQYKEVRKTCKNEIIEIGALMLDEYLEEVSSFKLYVKPEYTSKIYARISELTGITQNMVAGAEHFNSAITKFVAWCGQFGNDYKVYSWSGSDFSQFTSEIVLKETEVTLEIEWMLTNWEDFQKDYCELIEVETPISLEKALCTIGQAFLGKMHDALWDARNTAELFILAQNKDELIEMIDTIEEKMNHTEQAIFTLGDIFNFSILEPEIA